MDFSISHVHCIYYYVFDFYSPVSKHLLEICDLLDIERKMTLYKAMFYTNVKADRDPNFIKADSLKIELIAGGLNWKQQEFIIEKLQPNYYNEVCENKYI